MLQGLVSTWLVSTNEHLFGTHVLATKNVALNIFGDDMFQIVSWNFYS